MTTLASQIQTILLICHFNRSCIGDRKVTDAASFLTNFISSDFGDVNAEENTLRVGMNYVTAKVVCNTENIYIQSITGNKIFARDVREDDGETRIGDVLKYIKK